MTTQHTTESDAIADCPTCGGEGVIYPTTVAPNTELAQVRAQRYSSPIAQERMGHGLCPECGGPPATHSNDLRFWMRACDLTAVGVEDRIAQHRADLSSPPAWCLCGVVADTDNGTCGNCGLRIMTDEDDHRTTPGSGPAS